MCWIVLIPNKIILSWRHWTFSLFDENNVSISSKDIFFVSARNKKQNIDPIRATDDIT